MSDDILKFIFGLIIIVAIVIAIDAVHFHATHECTRHHQETCETTMCFEYTKGIMTCTTTPYTCDVCDEWRERR